MTFNQKLSMAMAALGVSQRQLSMRMWAEPEPGKQDVRPQRLSSKMKKADYSVDDFAKFSAALGVRINIEIQPGEDPVTTITMPDGTEI